MRREFSLGELLTLQRRPVTVEPEQEYAEIGVRSFGKGIFHKLPRTGLEVGDKELYLVKEGDFILQITFAWEGAVGLASAADDGMYCSVRFPTFRINEELCDPKYLLYYFRTPDGLRQLGNISPGSAGRNRVLSVKRVPEIIIYLPPLDEQHRIIAHIEALAAHIAEARGLRQQAVEEAKALLESCTDQVLMELTSRFGSRKFSEICTTITDGDHITPQFSTEGVKFIFVGNVSSGRLHFNSCKYVTEEYFAKIRPQRIPQRGDILYSAVGATLGVPALVDVDEPFCFQRHIAILKPDHSRLDSRFAWHMLQSGKVYQKAWSSTTGSAQPTIPLKAIRELEIPVPPIQEQQRIVTHLDDLHTRVDALKRLQTETSAELDALLPAVLDRAFRGELL